MFIFFCFINLGLPQNLDFKVCWCGDSQCCVSGYRQTHSCSFMMSGQLNTASSQQFCDQSVFVPSTSKMGSWEHRPSFHCAVLTCDSMLEPCHTNPFFKSSIRIYQYVTLISLSRGISWLLFHPICCCVSDSLPLSFFKKRKFVLIIQWFICAFKKNKNNFYYCVGFGACMESVLPLWILEPSLK